MIKPNKIQQKNSHLTKYYSVFLTIHSCKDFKNKYAIIVPYSCTTLTGLN